MERLTKERRDASNPEFVDRVAAINVRNMMKWIVDNSPTLASMVANGEIAIVGAMYDVATGRVEFLDGASVAGVVRPRETATRA
jgi:carbonic anhydrase